jgi:tRNA G18 (ribose-2'-O)-methylase SpoU
LNIQEIITLKNHPELVTLDGLNVVKKYFKFCGKLEKIFLSQEYLDNHPELNKSAESIQIISKEEVSNIIGYKYHRGVIGLAKKPAFKSIESLEGNIFLLNGVVNAENVGSICRSLAAFNVKNLIIDEKSCHPFIRRAIRVSMGNVFNLNIVKVDDVFKSIKSLKDSGFNIYAADYREHAISIKEISPESNKSVIIIGSEGHGINPDIYPKCDEIIKIDVDPEVEYLNAAVATSVLAFWLN